MGVILGPEAIAASGVILGPEAIAGPSRSHQHHGCRDEEYFPAMRQVVSRVDAETRRLALGVGSRLLM